MKVKYTSCKTAVFITYNLLLAVILLTDFKGNLDGGVLIFNEKYSAVGENIDRPRIDYNKLFILDRIKPSYQFIQKINFGNINYDTNLNYSSLRKSLYYSSFPILIFILTRKIISRSPPNKYGVIMKYPIKKFFFGGKNENQGSKREKH